MKMNSIYRTLFFPVLMTMLFISCKKENISEDSGQNLVSQNGAAGKGPESALIKAVRAATARYHSTDQAQLAGYEPDDHCVSVPGLGGMGYHWANQNLVDPEFDPLKPEVVLYATGPGGNLRLVAVEYIVLNVGQERPKFDDHLFDVGGTPVPVPHWSLHVWVHETNPTGIFMPFNPNITCP